MMRGGALERVLALEWLECMPGEQLDLHLVLGLLCLELLSLV